MHLLETGLNNLKKVDARIHCDAGFSAAADTTSCLQGVVEGLLHADWVGGDGTGENLQMKSSVRKGSCFPAGQRASSWPKLPRSPGNHEKHRHVIQYYLEDQLSARNCNKENWESGVGNIVMLLHCSAMSP